jgi:hypothetical protein
VDWGVEEGYKGRVWTGRTELMFRFEDQPEWSRLEELLDELKNAE